VVALVRRAGGIQLPVTDASQQVQTVEGSLLDYDTLSCAAEGCDAIINCAGTTDMSLRRYEDFLPVNRDLCAMLVRVMEERNIRVLVHTSTVNTIGYGTAEQPADESAPMRPPFAGSFYADSKREGEQIILEAAKEGRHVVAINPGLMLGPWDVKPSSGRMLLAAYRKPLMFAPKGGKAFVHVSDVAQAIVNALARGENGVRYIAVNGQSCLSIKGLYEIQAKVCGYRQKVFLAPNWLLLTAGRVGDVLRWIGVKTQVSTCNIKQLLVREYYDSSRVISDLGMPQTLIEEAIKEFHEWRKNNQ
jgi:nucleoside-diphosphate-sugar epimerase